MKLATWNVNSLTIRLPRLLDWLRATQPDVVCLQETKLEDERFPHAPIGEAGFRAFCCGQKTYNGVALLVRDTLPVADIATGVPGFEDAQKRVIAASVVDLRVICAYVPNGQAVGSDKYAYKLAWCDAATAMLRDALAAHPRLVFAGDLNIAPEPRDVHDPAAWEGQVLFSEPERERFRAWLATGLRDSFRLFDQPANTFTWWDYRMLAFPKNRGLRIDHILLSPALAQRCTGVRVDRAMRKGEKPSDHAPVIAEIAD